MSPEIKPEWTMIQNIFEEHIAFNFLIGFKTQHISQSEVVISFEHKPELHGNPVHKILHGGVISTALDSVGGMMALVAIVAEQQCVIADDWKKIMRNLGTIDLRVDFLRPGRGQLFSARSEILRKGNKIAVTRMELHNESNDLIAVGTGTYLVG